MTVVGQATLELLGESAQFRREMEGAARKFKAVGRELQSVGRSLSMWITAPLLAMGGAAVKTGADFESLELGLKAVTGSAAEAGRQLARLRAIAKLPAVDLEQAAKTSIAFQAIGKDAAFAERTIRGVANAVALSGGTGENFSGVVRQLRQVASLGRLMGEEMNVILENAPAMATALQKAFGTTSTEAIRKLNLSTDEFFERLQQGMEALPQVAGGAANTLQNLGQALREAANTIGQQLMPVVIPLIENFSTWLENLQNLNPELLTWGIALGAVAAAAGPLLIIAGQLTTAAELLASALSVGLLPLIGIGGAILIGLGLLSAGFLKSKLEAAGLRKELNDTAESFKELSKQELIAQFLGIDRYIQQLRIRLAELEQDAKDQRAEWERSPMGSVLKQSASPGVGVSDETKQQLAAVNAELDRMDFLSMKVSEQFNALALNTPPTTTTPPGGLDPDEMDKYVATLTDAVRMGLASTAQQRELRQLQLQMRTAATNANIPMERRLELLDMSRDAAAAGLEFERRRVRLTNEQNARLRLPSAGEVRASNLPTAETERAALGIERMSVEMEALGDRMKGIAVAGFDAFADFATGAGGSISDFVQGALRDLARLLSRILFIKALTALFPGSSIVAGIAESAGLGKRAAGGPVMKNRAYLVGERGPELFTPHSAGNITANNQLGGGAPVVVQADPPSSPDPFTIAANHYWQRLYRETARVAEAQGFKLVLNF